MNKIFSFLRDNNHYMRVIVGILVGLFAFSFWTAVYSSAVASFCLCLKDKLKGSYWSWADWLMTVAGGLLIGLLWLFV